MDTKGNHDRLKIALVIQRFGKEFAGGSEYLASWLASQLGNVYDVEILTTTAIDAITWENYFEPGESKVDGYTVRRFPVVKKREYSFFLELSDKVFFSDHNLRDEFQWFENQGPVCPSLVEYIEKYVDDYDLFVAITYLYYPTYYCLHKAKSKTIFIPTAHDEPPIFLTIYRYMFNLPKGIIFLSEEEKDFVLNSFQPIQCPWIIGGIGINCAKPDNRPFEKPLECNHEKLIDTYIFSCGRIEPAKGYEQLFDFFMEYKKSCNSPLKLVLAGNQGMNIPRSSSIKYLGFVPDEKKHELIKKSKAVIIPSTLESFSMIALETWKHGKPIIANGNSPVLKGHVLRSNGGWTYTSKEEFRKCLLDLEHHPQLAAEKGSSGKQYVFNNYSNEKIGEKYRNFVDFVLNLQNK